MAGVMGAAGIALAAVAAHRVQGPSIASAAQMLQVHAVAVLALLALAAQSGPGARLWLAAAATIAIGAALFATAVALPPLAGMTLFPMAAPIGGSIVIVGWLGVAIAAIGELRHR